VVNLPVTFDHGEGKESLEEDKPGPPGVQVFKEGPKKILVMRSCDNVHGYPGYK
jgi:hypothetical protein